MVINGEHMCTVRTLLDAYDCSDKLISTFLVVTAPRTRCIPRHCLHGHSPERHLRSMSMRTEEFFLSQLVQIDGNTQHFSSGTASVQMNLHLRRQKEFFNELSARSPITIIAGTAQRIARMDMQALRRYPSWRQVFGPCILALFGLVIAVALWGIGSKPSPYSGPAVPSARIPVARLWSGPKGASSPTNFRLRAKSYLDSGSLAFFVPISRPACLNRAVAYIPPAFRRGIAYFAFLIPFRSPPPQRFCLA